MVKLARRWKIALRVFLLFAGIVFVTNTMSVGAAAIPPTLNFELVASTLTQPVFITNAGDGSNRLFVVQQSGQIRIIKNGSLLSTPFLNIAGSVSNFTGTNGEQGLLGLAFDPDYINNGTFYISYTANTNNVTFPYATTVARYHVSNGNSDLADPSSGLVLLSAAKKYTNHNGGMIAFGPDGYLYISVGDGGSGGDPDNNAQNLGTLLGKVLRIDVHSTPAVGQTYVIPPTNPFYGSSTPGIKKEIWAYGLRNPWRFSFDRLTGDLYIGDVGQNREEEVDFQAGASTGGQNYGWRILEGNLCYNPSANCIAPAAYVPPVAVYDHGTNHSYGCSITGGYVYRGSQFPSLHGTYFYGDFCSGKVLGLVKNPNNTWTYSLVVSTNYGISSFGEDEQGELYLSDFGGGSIYKISPPVIHLTGNAGAAGVTMSYTDGTLQTVTSDGSGNYSITVPYGWTGTVQPYKTGNIFLPFNRSYADLQSNQTAQDYVAQACPSCADIHIQIAGNQQGTYTLGDTQSQWDSYVDLDDGPVKVESTNGVPLVASTGINLKRLPDFLSYTELMGLPASKLTDTYIFPWYNNATAGGLSSQVRFGNVGNAETDVTVTVGGVAYGPYHLGLNGSDRVILGDVDAGPVEVKSSGGVPIIASMRVNLKSLPTYSSYTEFMGVSASSTVGTKYMFPWYNNATAGGVQSQLRFGNMGNAETDVTVKVDGVTYGPYHLVLNGSQRVTLDDVDAGPVEVFSSGGVPIIASMRVNMKTNPTYSSYSEFMGMPGATLSETHYFFPWYNNATVGGLQSQLRFGNVGVAETDVTVKIGGVSYGPYHLVLNGSQRLTLDDVDAGPVEVFSSGGVPIIASMRINLKNNGSYSSYSEFMGLSVGAPLGMPGNELSPTYWFPWYNNATAGGLSSQLRFAVP